MRNKNRWLITIDLDGTTLTSTQGGTISFKIPQENKDALLFAQEKGHKIAVVTGRPWRDTVEIYNELGLHTVVGNYNGAYIHRPDDEGYPAQKTTINRRMLDEINRKYFTKYFTNSVTEDDKETIVADISDEKMLKKFHVHEDPSVVERSPETPLAIDPYSIIYRLKEGIDREEVLTVMRREFGNALNIRFWDTPDGDVFLEFNQKAINKAAAVQRIAAYYNIPMHRTLSIGDGMNDIEMLTESAIGVAMKNASAQVQAYADDVTDHDNNDAGVGKYIMRWLGEFE